LGAHIFPPREDGAEPRSCPSCKVGQLSLRLGKFGAFIGCSNYNADPPCKFTRPLVPSDNGDAAIPADGKELGQGPSGSVTLKTGRFGPYIEMPNGEEEKPKRASLPKGWSPDDLDLAKALKLLALPREVDMHPSENEMIEAGVWRYGPSLRMGKIYANLGSVEDVFEIQMNRAVALIDEKKAGGGKGRFQRGAAAALKELGESPVTGQIIKVMNGRYGPYVTDGAVNATLPRDQTPEEVTIDIALPLLAARAAAGPSKKRAVKKAAKKEAAPKKAAAKKTATKKAAAKKSTAKKATG
jgi:DNA topoisomerase-1